MKILILSQWFDPEPTLKGLSFARALVARGHEVEILTGFPNYPGGKVYPGYRISPFRRETQDGIRINRVALYPSHDRSGLKRMANYFSFALSACLFGPWLVRRPDVIYAYHPPLTTSLPAFALKLTKRVPVVYDIQDLWPDTLGATGMMGNPRTIRFIDRWARWVYRTVDRIVVLSPGFRRRLVERGVPPQKIDVVYNWNEARQTPTTPDRAFARENGFGERFTVMFAGSLGPAQALDAVLDAAKLCPEADFVFVGSGFERERLEARTRDEGIANARFLGQQPMEAMGGILPLADALLVHLRDDPLFEITIPSKTQAYLACGVPIVMAVSGDAAELVRAADAGLIVPPENPEALAQAVRALGAMTPEDRKRLGENGREYYTRQLSVDVGVRAFEAAFERTVAGSAPASVEEAHR